MKQDSQGKDQNWKTKVVWTKKELLEKEIMDKRIAGRAHKKWMGE